MRRYSRSYPAHHHTRTFPEYRSIEKAERRFRPIAGVKANAYDAPDAVDAYMKQTFQQSVLVLSAVLMIVLAFATLFAMVVGPACSGITQKAGAYQIGSLCVFIGAYYLLVWRRQSVIAAMAIPGSQIALGLLFLSYLNSLPTGCSR